MRITFPIITLCKGGAQRMLAELVNRLAAKGHDVKILMPSYGIVEYSISVPVIRVSGTLPLAAEYPLSDVIVSNFYTTVDSAAQASKIGRGKHARLSLCYEPPFLKDNFISFKTYHVTKNLFVLSKWQQDIIFLNHGIRGHIVPVGISPEFKNLGNRVPHDAIQVSAILRKPEGGYSWHRDQNYLIEQLHKVMMAVPSIKVNLIIPPTEFAESPSLQQLKNAPWLNVYTPANDFELNYHLNHTDIFVSSSLYDSASMPGLEAMKTGAALVTTYSGGNMDYCRNGQNCLISHRYEDKLHANVIQLVNNTPLRNRLAQEGMKEAQKWTWDRSAALFEAGLQRM
ncbi:glycosyltransferase family 4 protein [Fictibacillus iocasae]|uniref:Glycosyltransferase family 4 protein n=1 Tax=Fictibacillus iocasae TaxID=2715437 RepID=A0ABW2NUX9_9BACL